MNAQLLADIRAELTGMIASSPIYTNPTATDKLYEIYIFSCVVQALKQLGCTLTVRDHNDNPTSIFNFRLSPGYIYSPTALSSFVLASHNSKEFELHNGTRILGRATVLHELDVCLLTRDEAVRCRQNRIHPRQNKVKLLAECKFYGADLPLNLGREFLGLCSEFNARVKSIVSNVGSSSIHNLISSHKQTENFDLTPLRPPKVDVFIKWMVNELHHVL